MNKINRLFALMAVLVALPVAAEQSASTYFMESSQFRTRLNPALAPTKGYVAIPVLGNLQFGLESNLAATQFLFPATDGSGQLLTFLHPDVSADAFLGNLKPNSFFNLDQRLDILSGGFWVQRQFFSVGISTRALMGSNIPKEFFSFLKQGMTSAQGTQYDIRDLRVTGDVMGELSLGYSNDIFDNLRVGGTLKVLVDMASFQANIDHMSVYMSKDEWRIDSEASLMSSSDFLETKSETDADGNPYVSGFSLNPKGLGSGIRLGAAVDLGVTYRLLHNLTFSASVTDLGAIGMRYKRMEAKGQVSFSGIEGIDMTCGVEDGSIGDQVTGITDNLLKMVQFQENAEIMNCSRRLDPTLRLGVEYSVWKDRVSAGLLYGARFTPFGARHELTASVNFRPVQAVQLAASYNLYSDYSRSLGMALHLGHVFFISWDHMMFRYSPQFLPLNRLSTNIQFGLCVPFGKKNPLSPRRLFGQLD